MTTLVDRFWSKVNKTDDCWLWTGAIGTVCGYGRSATGTEATAGIGQRVVMTARGVALAKERGLRPVAGTVRELFHEGRRSEQVYVLRDGGGCEWWPTKCWRRE